jgi:hypothetical protein
MALPPPKRVKMGAFYRVLRPMELSAGMRYTIICVNRLSYEKSVDNRPIKVKDNLPINLQICYNLSQDISPEEAA